MTPPLVHYSKEPLDTIKSVSQKEEPAAKPEGLWFSVEDGASWKDWCEGEEFGLDRLTYMTEIVLSSEANILRLSSCEDIDKFTKKFSRETQSSFNCIDWTSIAKAFQGIIIAPYQWDCRLKTGIMWYYGWDCSSGCVWDETAITMRN